jgi:peptidoglycan hydrolase CwlO-like protein
VEEEREARRGKQLKSSVVLFAVDEYDLTMSFPSPLAGIAETTAYCKSNCAVNHAGAARISSLSSFYLSQREMIIERHEKKAQGHNKMINYLKKKIEKHESGRRKLGKDEYESLLEKISSYEKKIEKMKEPLDERVS